MEESAPKRRRISPRTSANPATGTPPESPVLRRRRPSFASPTKASLSRHNPEILERRRSKSPEKGPASRPSARRPSIAESEQSLSDLLTTQLESEAGPSSENGPQLSQEDPDTSSRRQSRRASGRMAAPARRSSIKLPNPRPRPSQGPDTDEEFNPFKGRALRRSPKAGSAPVAPTKPDPRPRTETEYEPQPELQPRPDLEPELPPSVPDRISPTSSKEIHRNSPQWNYKTKNDADARSFQPRLGKKPSTTSEPARQRAERQGVQRTAEETTDVVVRKIRPFDPDLEKKRQRDALLEEIRKLRKDLKIVQQANDRSRVAAQSGRTLSHPNQDEVMRVLRDQYGVSEAQTLPSATQQLMHGALNPGSLIPFGKPLTRTAPNFGKPEKLPEIASHHPVLMTAAEELPYLELFSPFEVSSFITRLQPDPEHPYRQLHAITLRSRETPGIFTANIDMVVDPMDLTVLDLNVPNLEPAAKAELGPFIEKICTDEDCNRCMQRNIGTLSWAMSEWLRVATERAVFWSQLEQWSGSKDVPQALKRLRERKSKRKKSSEDVEEDNLGKRDHIKREDLCRFLRQQQFDIALPPNSSGSSRKGSKLRLTWTMTFDWTGEAQSNIAVMLEGPAKWAQVDERDSLGKIPTLFRSLVDGGVKLETAVQTILALVAGEST